MKKIFKQHRLKKEFWKLFFIFLMLFCQYPIFIAIVYLEPILKPYFNVVNTLGNSSQTILSSEHVTEIGLFSTIWIAAGLFFCLTIFFILFIYTSSNRRYLWYQTSIMLSILILMIVSILLFNIAEIKYDWIMSWSLNIHKYYASTSVYIPLSVVPDFTLIDTLIGNGGTFFWIPDKTSIWISCIQIAILIVVFLNFQLKNYANLLDKKTIENLRNKHMQNKFSNNSFEKIIKNIVQPSPRNGSILLILGNIIVMIPLAIYLLKLTILNNSLSYLIWFNFLNPSYSQISNELLNNGYYYLTNYSVNIANLFFIFYLPLILFITNLGFVIVLIFFVLNDEFMSINFLLFLTYFLFGYTILMLISVLSSEILMSNIQNEWDKHLVDPKYSDLRAWVSADSQLLRDDGTFQPGWLPIEKIIALFVISSSFIVGLNVIRINHILTLKTSRFTNKNPYI